jgi:hypothetical protein
MTLTQFLALPPDDLPALVQAWGVYLGMCRRATDTVFLYRYPGAGRGFFVELYKSLNQEGSQRVRAFSTELRLEDELTLWTPTEAEPA